MLLLFAQSSSRQRKLSEYFPLYISLLSIFWSLSITSTISLKSIDCLKSLDIVWKYEGKSPKAEKQSWKLIEKRSERARNSMEFSERSERRKEYRPLFPLWLELLTAFGFLSNYRTPLLLRKIRKSISLREIGMWGLGNRGQKWRRDVLGESISHWAAMSALWKIDVFRVFMFLWSAVYWLPLMSSEQRKICAKFERMAKIFKGTIFHSTVSYRHSISAENFEFWRENLKVLNCPSFLLQNFVKLSKKSWDFSFL